MFLREHLNNIVNGINMCALCLKEVTDDAFHIYDEILMKNNHNKSVLELITFIIGYNVSIYYILNKFKYV